MASIDKEAFERLRAKLDKDGDGQVSKDELKVGWKEGIDNDISDEDFDKLWVKIDADGDGNMTVKELAAFFNFDLDSENSNEMSDEQILMALSMQMALAPEKAEINEEVKDKPRGRVRDQTLTQVNLEKKKKDAKPNEERAVEFLENCQMYDIAEVTKALKARAEKPEETQMGFIVRVEDEKGEMALHKLARTPVKLPGMTAGCDEAAFTELVKLVIEAWREEVETVNKSPLTEVKTSLYKDVNHQDKAGKTPLSIAIEYKNTKMMELLFDIGKEGPDTLLKNLNGWTAMHVAVHSDDLSVLKKFCIKISGARLKALLKTADKTGREPLHIAAYKSSEDMVSFLIEQGADATNSDTGGNTAAKLATRSGRRKSKEILEDQEKKQKDRRASKEQMDGAPAPAAAPETAVEKARARRRSKEGMAMAAEATEAAAPAAA